MFLCILCSSNSCKPNTQVGRNPMFTNALFTMCIPILFRCFSYPYVFRILQAKGALTELFQLQIGVEENFVWFVLLLPRCRPPHLSCSSAEASTKQDIMTPDRLSPPQISFRAAGTQYNCFTIIDSEDEPKEYMGPQERSHSFVSAYVMHCLILPATLSSCSPLRLQLSSKLMFKLEF